MAGLRGSKYTDYFLSQNLNGVIKLENFFLSLFASRLISLERQKQEGTYNKAKGSVGRVAQIKRAARQHP